MDTEAVRTVHGPVGYDIDEKTLNPRALALVNKISFEVLRCNQHPKRICQWFEKEPEFRSLDAARIVGLKSQIKALLEAIDVLTEERSPWKQCDKNKPPRHRKVLWKYPNGALEVCAVECLSAAQFSRRYEMRYMEIPPDVESKDQENEFVRRCRIAFQKKQEEYRITWPNNLGLAEIAGDIAREMNEETARAEEGTTSNA